MTETQSEEMLLENCTDRLTQWKAATNLQFVLKKKKQKQYLQRTTKQSAIKRGALVQCTTWTCDWHLGAGSFVETSP